MNKTLLLWTTGDFHGPHLPHEHPGGTHRWVRTYVWYQGHCQRAPLAQGNDTKRLYLAMMNSCVMLPWLGLAAAQLDSSHSSTSQVTLPILFPHLLSRCSHIWEHLLPVLPLALMFSSFSVLIPSGTQTHATTLPAASPPPC